MSDEVCISCRRGLHGTCRGKCDCTHGVGPRSVAGGLQETITTTEDEAEPDSRVRRTKADSALKDQQSTGRKRAARLYPLDREAICEWSLKPQQGGGISIPGCGLRPGTIPGKQQSRHHGPDYNTLNNDAGNVHRICHSCHNSWHAVNDPHKDERYLEQYGIHAGGKNFKNSKVLVDKLDEEDYDETAESDGELP